MKTSRRLIIVLIVLWGVASSHLSAADLYQGRVVDEETGQPLAGAVLTVVWFRSPILGFEGTRDFLSAQETVADSDGKFSLTVSPGIDWNPFSYIRKEPEIVIYQPGYEPTWAGWRDRNKFKSSTEFAEALKKDATIKLPKLKSKEQLGKLRRYRRFDTFPPDVRNEQVSQISFEPLMFKERWLDSNLFTDRGKSP